MKWVLILSVAALVLWTVGLGQVPLRDWDEGYYAVVAREMVQQHTWLYPTRFGEPYFPKPPFGYWLGSLGYLLFGVANEFTLRLPMAVSTALGVPLLYGVVRQLTYQRREALLTAGVYMTLLPVVRLGRLHMFDGFINTLMIGVLWCILRSHQRRPWALGIGLCLAGIALSKGILAIALGGIALAFVVLDRQTAILKNPYTWVGLALGLLLTLGWNGLQWFRYGDVFVQEHLGFHNVARVSSVLEDNAGPPWYYLLEIAKYTFPWLLFWPGGLWLAWRSRHTSRGILVLTGNLLFLGMASVMGTKLPWYIMPLYPFFALAAGWQLSRQAYVYKLRWLFAGLIVVGLGGIAYFLLADPQVPLVLLAVCLTVTMGLLSWQLMQRNMAYSRTLIIGIYSCLLLLMMSRSWLWEINEAFPVVAVGQLISDNTPPGQVVYTSFAYGRPSLEFYASRPVAAVGLDDLRRFYGQGHYLLLEQAAVDQLAIASDAILGTAEGFNLVEPVAPSAQVPWPVGDAGKT
ncbi:MAG: glycosyltransferase family 39 protein [Cyanobacteria bacterium J06632_22]